MSSSKPRRRTSSKSRSQKTEVVQQSLPVEAEVQQVRKEKQADPIAVTVKNTSNARVQVAIDLDLEGLVYNLARQLFR